MNWPQLGCGIRASQFDGFFTGVGKGLNPEINQNLYACRSAD